MPLDIGTIDAIFQGEGIEPVVIDKLKSLVTEGAMAAAVYFNICADIIVLSGPEFLSTFNDNRKSYTSSSVQRYSLGHLSGDVEN